MEGGSRSTGGELAAQHILSHTYRPTDQQGMDISSMSMMMACMMLGLTAIYVVYILLRHEQKPREVSSASRVLPGPVGLPILGNAFTFLRLLRHSPHRALTSLSRAYGPIFSFRPGMTCTFVVLSSQALAREALAERGAGLAARFVPDSMLALAYSKGSMAFLPSSSPLWKQHRVTVGAFLTSGSGLAATRPIRDHRALEGVLGLGPASQGRAGRVWCCKQCHVQYPLLQGY